MGLIEATHRCYYVWSWRTRYWFLDTHAGKQTQLGIFALAIIIAILECIRMAVHALFAPPSSEPQQAFYWWIIQLIILIIAAAVSYATRPRPQQPAATQGDAPSTQDGQAVKDVFGTVWIDDEFLLAWKILGTVPIKSKGGKK